jgi:hypothetical protein
MLPLEVIYSTFSRLLGKKVLFSTREIDKFLSGVLELEDWRRRTGGKIELKRGSEDYYKFLKVLGETVSALNRFLSAFIVELERKKGRKEEGRKFSRFLRYMNALTTLSVRKYFFRELPVQAQNFPLLSFDKNIVDDAVAMYIWRKRYKEIKNNIVRLLFFLLPYVFIHLQKEQQRIGGSLPKL